MADQIRPTPRSPILGLFSDLVNLPLEYMSAPQRTQQMQGVAEFIRSTGVPSTLERLSYGQGLFTGAGGLGGTTRLRPEVAEAALTVAPMVGPAARLAGRAVMATKGLPVGMGIKSVGKIDELTGLPLNPDGTVTLFHHTNKNAAEQIAKTGRLKSAGEPSVYLTTQKTPDTGYGDVVVPVRVRPSMLNLDDEFPSGRMDFSIDVGRPKGSIPVVVEKPSFEYPQEEALRLAQQRAALPVSEGGLGLPPNNTPMDRARAMGFGTESFHGTKADVQLFDKSKNVTAKDIYSSPNPVEAGAYAEGVGGNVMPLLLRGDVKDLTTDSKYVENQLRKAYNAQFSKYERQYYPFEQFAESFMRGQLYQDTGGQSAQNALVSELIGNKKSILKIPDAVSGGGIGESYVVADPSKIRSRFAAFDPTRRNEPDLLAGALPFTALLDEENRQALGEFLSNPIMYRDPFGSTVR